MADRLEAVKYGEAPQLSALVSKGLLPPISERLPRNPMLVQPVERIGAYGGVWRMAMKGKRDHAMLARTLGYENLVRWDPEWTRIVPNIAQSFDVNTDATEFTFHLRQGMRWSDGAPFTADDMLFWYEDVFSNKHLTKAPSSWLVSGGKPVVLEKIDEYTIVFRFAAPYGLFLQYLASPQGDQPTIYPRHYLKQFHIDHNRQGITNLIKDSGATNWIELFNSKVHTRYTRLWNTELPSLNAWILNRHYQKGDKAIVAERNPYYWKIDTEFNQLPYIDRIVYTIVKDIDAIQEMAISGQIDMQDRRISNNVALAEYMESGGYHLYQKIRANSNELAISLNLTHRDPVLRRVFQNKDFRIGLSHAMDRQRIIKELNQGEGEPCQVAPLPYSPFYNERLAKQYITYDLKLANHHLDIAGYKNRDGAGFRLGPDGKRISFVIQVPDNRESEVPYLDLIQTYWRDVGIDMRYELAARDIVEQRVRNNMHDATVWVGVGGLDVILAPRHYLPASWQAFNVSYAVA